MLDTLRHTLTSEPPPLLAPGDTLLVAVSGGPDSLSLLHALHSLREEIGLRSIAAAHFDHGLRGDESAAEALWVADWCETHGIKCHDGRADVAALAQERKLSIPQAAREARYAFLSETAAAIGANKIATGHTQDDQAETVLLNILRGTGTDGLRGIPRQRGLFVRPLLAISRMQIEEYCAEHALCPRRDSSNAKTDYTRNRVRLELLPQLAREYNPGIQNALLRLSEIAVRDSDYLHAQAQAALIDVLREQDAFRLTLDRAALAQLHPALLRYVLRDAIARLRGTVEGVAYEQIDQVCRFISNPAPSFRAVTLTSPICTFRVTEAAVTLALANVPSSLAYMSTPLSVPGEATLTEIGWTIRASFEENENATMLDADAVQGELTLRNWRIGDRIAPLGMNGHTKKVSDIFIDAKVPKARRHHIPIIADEAGILWIAGYAVAERAKTTARTTRRLWLTAKRLSEESSGV